MVDGKSGSNDLDFVAHAVWEEGTVRSVDQTGCQDSLLGRAAASLNEPTWNLADGVLPLFIITCQREEVQTFPRGFGHGGRAEDDRFSNLEPARSPGLLGDSARFKAQRLA